MQDHTINVLIIEDEEYDVRRIRNTLKPFEAKISVGDVVSNARDALSCLKKNRGVYDVIIMDYQISGGLRGEQLIKEIKKIDETLQIIVITKMTINQTDLYFANQLLGMGAYWFGTKYPADIEEYIYQPTDFILSIMNAYEKKQLEIRSNRSQRKLDRTIQGIVNKRPLIGDSPLMMEIRELIRKYAVTPASVLITGESGTGKELVAMNIHYQSPRKYENFVPVNCAAIPKDLIESELFGFERGSFTGAKDEKPGLFEQAAGGTIFLDEIGEMPIAAQAKLLRVLESGELDKIGRKKRLRVDVRVIASTNKNLKELMEKKRFREDLYYRLNILHIKTYPLREHPEDIPQLIDYFMNYYGSDLGIIPPTITSEGMDLLIRHPWPGNVRQVKNVVQRLLLSGVSTLTPETIETCLGTSEEKGAHVFSQPVFDKNRILPLSEIETAFRKNYIRFVRNNSATDAEAARKLGIAPPNFHRLCKDLGLK
jgi:DNA-binding NtrC family response regulator